MRKFVFLVLFFLPFCSPNFYHYNIDLGIKSAKMRLWKEALYRFKRATEIKETAQAYNNMAVAYEALGNFKEAEKCYKKALKFAPKDREIRANYAIFLELRKEGGKTGKSGKIRSEKRKRK